jgi:pyridine nucleotide-disulfide oxidoreductase
LSSSTDVAIIGSGPFGLSIAAYLKGRRIEHRIFGKPMDSWVSKMPRGMLLKSDGFASSLYDPDDAFTLARYCQEAGLPYADIGLPVPIETFTAYGLEFQKRFVPYLEPSDITGVRRAGAGFDVTTAAGETFNARRVIVASGITYFSFLPPALAELPPRFRSHTSEHAELTEFRGKRVAVLGAGSSAVDTAALLSDAGATVDLVARAATLAFHSPPREPRPLLERILKPRSGLGVGWRSRLCVDAPLLFHKMPESFRLRVVKRHLGPSSGWFVRDKIVGKVEMHLGVSLANATVRGEKVELELVNGGSPRKLEADHVIGGTGYRVSLQKLPFLSEDLRASLRSVADTPILSPSFESSVPNLYFVGLAAANAFGPLMRFAFGARFAARRVTQALARV